jgi:hypothetical protein
MIAARAWVESPLQLLCTVEYAAASGIPVRILPLKGAAQLAETARYLETLGLPPHVLIEGPRRSPRASGLRHGRDHWIVGDAYSRFTRLALAAGSFGAGRLRWLTIVDDGAITMSLVDVIAGEAPLERPDRVESAVVKAIARRARARLLKLVAQQGLEIFSFYPLGLPALRPHAFEWLRSRVAQGDVSPATLPEGSRVILGSAAVVDGRQDSSSYLDWVGAQELPASYFPHRRETREMTTRVSQIAGITVVQPGIPIELVLAQARGIRIASQSTSALTTLEIILRDRDCVLPAGVATSAQPSSLLAALTRPTIESGRVA